MQNSVSSVPLCFYFLHNADSFPPKGTLTTSGKCWATRTAKLGGASVVRCLNQSLPDPSMA